VRAGEQPTFYQEYFEPARDDGLRKRVLRLVRPMSKPLENFLLRRTDRFSCEQIPGRSPVDRPIRQRHAVSEVAVAATWRVRGISWSRARAALWMLVRREPLPAAYGILRLGIPRCSAIGASVALASDAAFATRRIFPTTESAVALALTFLVDAVRGRFGRRPSRWRAYGLVLGIGYGFRSDLLAHRFS